MASATWTPTRAISRKYRKSLNAESDEDPGEGGSVRDGLAATRPVRDSPGWMRGSQMVHASIGSRIPDGLDLGAAAAKRPVKSPSIAGERRADGDAAGW